MCCMHVAGGEGGTLNGGTCPSKTYLASGLPVVDFQALAGILLAYLAGTELAMLAVQADRLLVIMEGGGLSCY